jgi:hypothetical protein
MSEDENNQAEGPGPEQQGPPRPPGFPPVNESGEYTFIKQAHLETLKFDLDAAGISHLVDTVEVSGNLVRIVSARILMPAEELRLRDVVVQHRSQSVVDSQAKEVMIQNMQFGNNLIAEIAAENVTSGINSSQVLMFVKMYGPIIALLQTGSIKTALQQIEALVPNGLVTKERIHRTANRIRDYLGMPLL